MAREVDLGSGSPSSRPRAESRSDAVETVQRRRGRFRLVRESVDELKKVEWPNQTQVIQGAVVVITACVIVGAYLWLNDQVWKQVVEKILGQ